MIVIGLAMEMVRLHRSGLSRKRDRGLGLKLARIIWRPNGFPTRFMPFSS